MSDVKWIKIVTDIFDDEKILLIESMPEADSVIVIWFKLLCLAGKHSNKGVFTLNDRIAYTDEMLSTIFRRPINTVRLALKMFEQYGMIEIVNGVITIPNWSKHQTLDKIEARREYQRVYMAAKREEQKLLASCETNSEANSKTNVSTLEEDIDNKDNKEKKEKEKNLSLEIKNFRQRYSDSQLSVIDNYIDILRWTRKNGVIAESVIYKIYQEWERYHADKVVYALNVYVKNPKYHDKKENYCYGIMRNSSDKEVYAEEEQGYKHGVILPGGGVMI